MRRLMTACIFCLVPAISCHGDTPNIVFIYADDLGIGDVGCFGNTTVRTPNIDSLCEEGVKLTQHLAAAPACTPSRAALLTSRYPIRTGLASAMDAPVQTTLLSTIGLPPGEFTIAEMLKEKGYSTALIGKWHLGLDCKPGDRCHNPTRFGFDYFFGFPLSNIRDLGDDEISIFKLLFPRADAYLVSATILTLVMWFLLKRITDVRVASLIILPVFLVIGFLGYVLKFPHVYNSVLQRNLDIVEMPFGYEGMTQRLVNEGIRFLEMRREDKKPFFLMMSWLQVHSALHASKQFKGRSPHGAYGDEVEEMDWATGEILTALSQLDLLSNTFIYFSSDNGGHKEDVDAFGRRAGGWNGIYKGSKGQGGQEGAIRMPAAVKWTGRLPAGSEVSEPTSQMDLMVTLAGIVGGRLPRDRHIDGRDILPLLEGKSRVSPHEFLFHYCSMVIHSVRYRPPEGNDVYKLYFAWPAWEDNSDICNNFMCRCYSDHYGLETPKLFNIADDPEEAAELNIKLPQFESIVAKINDAVKRHEATITNAHPPQMTTLAQIGRPWNHPFCDFPVRMFCKDDMNALNYQYKFYERT